MSPEASSRLKLLLLAAVWLAVIGSGVAYCVCCWLLSAANGKRARALQVHDPHDIAHIVWRDAAAAGVVEMRGQSDM